MIEDSITIETARLIMRPWKQEDLLPFSKINSDPRVMEFFSSILSTLETEAMIVTLQERFKVDGFSF